MTTVYDIFYYGAFEGYVWAASEEAAITKWLARNGYDELSAGYSANASHGRLTHHD